MKRITSLLIALLLALTPLFSLADDVWQATVSWQADQSGVEAWLVQAGFSQKVAEQVAPAASDLMNTLSLNLLETTNQGQLSILLNGWKCITSDFLATETEQFLNCSMFPGITISTSRAQNTVSGFTPETLAELEAQFSTLLLDFVSQVPAVTETGRFISDAYECSHRTVYTVSDAELARLLQQGGQVLIDTLNTESILSLWDRCKNVLKTMAEKNAGSLQLVVGTDESGAYQGTSLTCSANGKDYLSFSVSRSGFAVLCFTTGSGTRYLTVEPAVFTENQITLAAGFYCTAAPASWRVVKDQAEALVCSAQLDLTMEAESEESGLLKLCIDVSRPDGRTIGSRTVIPVGLLSAVERTESGKPVSGALKHQLSTVATYGTEKLEAWRFDIVTEWINDVMPAFESGEALIPVGEYSVTAGTLLSDSVNVKMNDTEWLVKLIQNVPGTLLQLIYRIYN